MSSKEIIEPNLSGINTVEKYNLLFNEAIISEQPKNPVVLACPGSGVSATVLKNDSEKTPMIGSFVNNMSLNTLLDTPQNLLNNLNTNLPLLNEIDFTLPDPAALQQLDQDDSLSQNSQNECSFSNDGTEYF